jgi:MFS family permease
MNVRAMGSVVLGLAIWQALFMAVGIGFGLLWPDYRLAARTYFASQDFSQFTVAMMLLNFALFAIVGAICGWLVTRIGGTRTAGLVFAALSFAYGAYAHFYREWGNLPDWYNLIVPWIITGSIVIGARCSSASPPATPSAESPADR